jgi:hypothetical protein
LDIDEKHFGDLTLVKWESRDTRKNGNSRFKTDENMNSFLFTLKICTSARELRLKVERNDWAIRYYARPAQALMRFMSGVIATQTGTNRFAFWAPVDRLRGTGTFSGKSSSRKTRLISLLKRTRGLGVAKIAEKSASDFSRPGDLARAHPECTRLSEAL